jgi:hypothetical protein
MEGRAATRGVFRRVGVALMTMAAVVEGVLFGVSHVELFWEEQCYRGESNPPGYWVRVCPPV